MLMRVRASCMRVRAPPAQYRGGLNHPCLCVCVPRAAWRRPRRFARASVSWWTAVRDCPYSLLHASAHAHGCMRAHPSVHGASACRARLLAERS